MPETIKPLKDRILEALEHKPGQKAAELAQALECARREVNQCLSVELAGSVQQGSDYRWRMVSRADAQMTAAPASTTEIAKLCRYYLECINQDLDEGASVFAKNQYGDLDYANLRSVPIVSGDDWWNAPGVGRLLNRARQERGKLMLWLGYPVHLRQHRSPRWEGFFVEPVLLWPVVLQEANGDPPDINEHTPIFNPKFLHSMAVGDGTHLAEEAARLSDELGLSVPADELPDLNDLVERLVRIRPDWGWKETLDPSICQDSPPLADIATTGIYNRAVIISGKRSPYTYGLETELKSLEGTPMETLGSTALGRWLSADVSTSTASARDEQPLIEVLPMNTEQRLAVQASLTEQHTVITGPPGTGKSQVVTNMLVNAAWRGMKVLFASKNNKAVDVVEARFNGLGNRPVLLRMGAKDYQAHLASHLTRLLAGNPGSEVKASHDEALEHHQSLATRLAELDKAQQKTLDCRNLVDRLDAETEDDRQIFGAGFSGLTAESRDRAEAGFQTLSKAVDEADREKQGLVGKIFWGMLRAARYRRLVEAARNAEPTFQVLKVACPPAPSEDKGVSAWRESLSLLRKRIDAVNRVVQYREALTSLQALPSFEDIARQRASLVEEISQNSARLWRSWVELMPTRLTPTQRRDVADYAAVLQLITGPGANQVHPTVRQRARMLQSRVAELFSCQAVTSLSARGRIPLEPGHFDLVVIDEASQCDIASVLPLLYRAKRSVIIGDPMQLRHISALTKPRDSELQHKHGLVETRIGWMYSVSSLFDVAAGIAPPESIINLRDHHRSHADIIEFSNEVFYEGRLRAATRYQRLKRPNLKQPGIVWQDVRGTVTRPRGGGAQNTVEAKELTNALIDLLVVRAYTGTVGVVTPFRAQAELLQEMLRSRPELERVAGRADLLVDTVHKFQGDERDVMFFSPVISNGTPSGALGFLRSNGNLFNVAITRARGLLHVIGDRSAANECGVDYLEKFAAYVDGLEANRETIDTARPSDVPPDYPTVAHPERVSEWERILYRAMVAAGLKPIPQFRVEQYDLDFALVEGECKLAIEVDGERYHRSWTGELCLRDQLRNQRLIELGWDVQRFWVYEVRDELDRCVQVLADRVASRAKTQDSH